jgi:multisubunit Na+/H+ antiporter MnhC subunit
VQLQTTQQLGAPTATTAAAPPMSTIGSFSSDDEDEDTDTIPTVLSIIAFVLSLAVLALALMTWTQEHQIGDLFN